MKEKEKKNIVPKTEHDQCLAMLRWSVWELFTKYVSDHKIDGVV